MPKHSLTVNIPGQGITTFPISEKAYQKVMRIPWNVPINFQGAISDPITSYCIRGYKILLVD